MRHARFCLALLFCMFLGLTSPLPSQPGKTPAQAEKASEPDAEELKDRAIADRFQRVLEGNPRRGTALDRLYGYYVERGWLDKLVDNYTLRTQKAPKDGAAWMILGMLESQRGRDAAAVAHFRQAETCRPGDALAPYYLGQSLILVGQPDAAAEAYERAIRCKPNRNDLLDIFQALGRVYQRAQRADKALDVWNRLEKEFPADMRVQEQIATTLIEEGQFQLALPRLVKLADETDDKYRQSTLRMDVADLKVKLKRSSEALADFEKILADLNPDSWLYRDVRRRTEEVFLRNDDLAGLAKYYEEWLAKHPADVDAIARLAKTLSSQGRAPEAKTWLSRGVASAPSHRGLRQALLDQYVVEQNFAAAAREYEAMDKANPNNPDILREWGKLCLRDTSRPEAERRAAAVGIWKRLLDKKANDPVIVSQVADLIRTAGAEDEAIALYKKAIALAPGAAQYREYLGEYLHSLNRHEEALAAWRPIAEGPSRTSKNLARLAEVFSGFGYRKEALAAMADAISLEKDDFTLLMTYAELLHQEGRNDDALKQIAAATRLTSNPEEVEQVLLAEIKVLQAADMLGNQIDALQAQLSAGKEATPERWLRLARFYEANRQADKAGETIAIALEKTPRSIPALIAAARIFESSGSLLTAVDTYRKLAGLDRRYRSEYLTTVARLEQRLGRREQALQAGRDLLAASPGNPDVYKFFADLCFQLGDQEEGLEALRRSVRANPSDPQGLIVLANALAERVRQGEAIELLWRAFEKSNDLDAKLSVIDRITVLYLENNQLDRLLERLERERREADKAREITLCIAQAYTTAGDLGTARQKLERLLTENTRDTHLLVQLGILCEQEGDVAAAVKFQRQLLAAAPNNYDHQQRLAQLLTRAGDTDEAAEIWVKLAAEQTEPHRNLVSIDSLFAAGKHEMGLAILSRLLARKPGNWELLYREGAALTARGKADEAAKRFRTILDANLADDELGENAKYQIKQAKKKQPTAGKGAAPGYNPNLSGRSYDEWANPPLTRRLGNVYEVRRAIGMNPDYYYGGPQAFFAPSDYGQARMACLGWLHEQARAKNENDAFVARLRKAKDKGGADPRALWDWYYFQSLRSERKDVLATVLTLSKGSDPAGLLALLHELGGSRGSSSNRSRRGNRDEAKDTTPPLPADQLDHAMACFRKLKQVKPDWVTSAVTTSMLTELRRAKRTDDEKAVYLGIVQEANTLSKVRAALSVAADRKDVETFVELFGRLERLQPQVKSVSALGQMPSRQASSTFETLMGKLADDKQLGESRKVLDLYLTSVRRQNLSAPKAASSGRATMQSGNVNIQLYSSKGYYRRTELDYPPPNEYFDSASISLLYNAFDLHKKADLLSDLFAHVRKQMEAAQGAERLYHQLAAGYVHWWSGDKDQAASILTDAAQGARSDHRLLIEVAALREINNEFEAALALLDSITPLDTQMMQRREEAAMRLAERTGNLERARQAAERLFGLRLDADKQLELASRMHRLGLPEMAEAILGRTQRQAGNKTATLLRLMTQYQSQNQTEQAVQIARQILRKGPSYSPNPRRRGGDENENARSQAIGVLARSGNLKEMTERAEAQLKASPNSIPLHQALASYYQAMGDKGKLKATLLKIVELKPADGKLRYTIAEQLRQAGERDAALDQYKAALKLEPSVLSQNYWQIQQLFSQADRFEELAQILDEIDLRKVGQYYYVSETIASMMSNEKGRELGLKLFKKAWAAYPQYRSQLLAELQDPGIWRLPEIYTYTKEAVIPREDSDSDPWQSAGDYMNAGQDGRIDAVLTKMMAIARKQQRLPELRAEVAGALAKRPDWFLGQALLGIIDVQSGLRQRGIDQLRKLFDDPKADPPPIARFILCQELEFYAGCEALAVKTLEAGIEELLQDPDFQFSYGPARRLVWWYQQLGRTDDAKKLLLRFGTPDPANDPGYSAGWWSYRIVHDAIAVGGALEAMGEPVEAVRIYNRVLSDKEALEQAMQHGGERIDTQLRAGLRSAIKAIRPATLPAAVNTLLTPRPPAGANQSVLDLVMIVESRGLNKATLTSLVATALKSTEKAPAIRSQALARLADLGTKYPSDFSVHTAFTLAAFAQDQPTPTRAAVDRLLKLAELTPLEPLPPNGKPNARQRAEALAQVPLWLVARECLAKNRKDLWPAGLQLAQRAAAAAKRQPDSLLAMTILREWGELDLERGDKAKAESHWRELLDLIVPKRDAKKAAALQPREADRFVAALQVVPQAKMPAPASPGNASVLTADQFQRAYELAALAVDKGIPALSLAIMRKAVSGGPPIVETKRRNGGGSYRTRIINGVQYLVAQDASFTIDVDKALLALVPKWTSQQVAPAETYELLSATVLPEGRPAEVFLYNEGQTLTNVYRMVDNNWVRTDDPIETEGAENGLADLLLRVAIDAGKTDDLRARIEARAAQPLSELPAKLLLTLLALKTKDKARATQLLEALGERVKKDARQATNNRITAVALAAFTQPEYAKMLMPIIEKLAENHVTGSNNQKAAELRFKLAQYHLANKDEKAARAQYKLVGDLGKDTRRGGYDGHLALAREYLKASWAEDALNEVGVHIDNFTAAGADPRGRSRREEPTFEEFPWLVRLLLAMPAQARYAALKTWSLPTKERKSVRYLIGVMPESVPPPAFVKLPPMPTGEVVSTMVILAEAAREAGKLDELTAQVEKLAADKVENADLLRVLVLVVQKKGPQVEPALVEYTKTVTKRLLEEEEKPITSRYYDGGEDRQPIMVRLSELLCSSRCLDEPALAKFGETLVDLFRSAPRQSDLSDRVRALNDRIIASRAGAPNAMKGGVPPRWQAVPSKSVWFAQDGFLAYLNRNEGAHLMFDRPLAGAFEFSVDAWLGEGIGYGGVVFTPHETQGATLLAAIGSDDNIFRTAEGIRQAFNRLSVQVSAGKVRYLVNGRVVFEDTDPPPTAPWLMLVPQGGDRAVFRHFAITGKPEVLSEVKLTAGKFLDGWTASIYNGRLPRRLAPKERDRSDLVLDRERGPDDDADENDGKEPVYDWNAAEGELLGRKLPHPSQTPAPSCLSYFRPVRPGETIRYEFFYEPGKTHVHPSLGRQAFLLDPDGVRLHWMTHVGADDWIGLPGNNAINDPVGRRGKVVLKAGAWNAVALTATEGGVKIELNGALVYESSLSPAVESKFGFFHYRDQTAARVRNVVLTGPWTKAVGTAEQVALTATPASPAVAVARRWLLGETYYTREAAEVVARATKLPPAERYQMLADWVLPTEFRPAFQLAGEVNPRDVLQVLDLQAQPKGQRVMLGGQFALPALEMIGAAKDCGALEQLCERIAKLSPSAGDEVFRRSQAAILAVARAAGGQDAAAAEHLAKLAKDAGALPIDAPGRLRWPDLVAVLGTASRPKLGKSAANLADAESKNIEESITRKRPFEDADWWLRAFRTARAMAEPPAPPLAFWAPTAALTAQSRGQGCGVPVWAVLNGAVVHHPGHDNDYLILRTPLRGDFEVTCGLGLRRWQQAQVRYGAYQFDLAHDGKKYTLHTTIRHESRPSTINPPLPPPKGDTYQFKLSVKDGWLRAFVDGREVVAEKIGAKPDPWLMIHASHDSTARIQDFKITGNPTVPDKIDLLIGDDLGMWRPYFPYSSDGPVSYRRRFADEDDQPGMGWTKRGEEMYSFGKKPEPPEDGRPIPPRYFPESALFYQRPFVENGSVDYEFFYDPDKAHVHPALDRMTFLLEPDGVKLHWLTDGRNDKSGVPFDNAKDEPECRRGPAKLPLKAKEWNTIRLTVTGDVVTVLLNNTPVYERSIEPTNQRLFGLFHYSDRTEARVRGLVLTGDWPRSVPQASRLFEHK